MFFFGMVTKSVTVAIGFDFFLNPLHLGKKPYLVVWTITQSLMYNLV